METKLDDFIINEVESQEVYDAMLAAGLIKDDELYLVKDADANGAGSAGTAVLYTPQELTEEQKAQARINIGLSEEFNNFIPKSGGTMTGALTLANDPTNAFHASTKQYVDNAINGISTITKIQVNGTDIASSGTANIPAATTSVYGVTKLNSTTNSTSTTEAATASAVKAAYDLANGAMPKGGGTFTGAVTLSGAPTNNLHAATKKYVDDNKYTHPSSHPASMITGLESAIENLGFSKIVYGTYVGDGASVYDSRTITLPFAPTYLILHSYMISNYSNAGLTSLGLCDGDSISLKYATSYSRFAASLSGTTLTVGNADDNIGANVTGKTYLWIAFA